MILTSAYSILMNNAHRGVSFGSDLNLTSPHVLGFLVIWCASILTALYDAINPNAARLHEWTHQGRIGATLFCLLLIAPLGLFSWGMFTSILFKHGFDRTPGFENSSHSSTYFSKYIYLGSTDAAMQELPEPPKGDRYLTGQFLFDNEPVEGIRLSLILNNEYKAKGLKTDSNGRFKIMVEPKSWYVNLIIVEGWDDAPSGAENFVVIKPNETKYVPGERYMDSIFYQNENGFFVEVTEELGEPHLTVTIKEDIPIIWPLSGEDAELASIEDDIISWNQVNNASRYLLEISRLERNGTSTGIYPVITKEISGSTSVPLSGLTHAKHGAGKTEYKVDLFAFDDTGNLISKSAEYGYDALFNLPDGVVLVENTELEVGISTSTYSQQEVDTMAKNGGRFEAADLLIQDSLYSEAEAVLDKVAGEAKPGQLLALRGYLQAAQGNCELANSFFINAIDEAGTHCVLERYRAKCPY